MTGATVRLTRRPDRARQPRERARGRQPAPGPARPADQRPARAGRHRRDGVRARRPACAPRAWRARALAALDEALRSGMIEELPSRPTASASLTSSCDARSMTDCPASAAAELISGSPKRSRPSARAPSRASRRPRASFRGGRSASGRQRAIEYNLLPRHRQRPLRRLRRGHRPAAHRARTRDRAITGDRARCPARARQRRSHRAGRCARGAARRSGGGARSRATLRDAELLARAAIGYEDGELAPRLAEREPASCSGRRKARSARRLRAARRPARRARARARLPG